MLRIKRFTCEGLDAGCVTDEARPRFGFSLESDREGASLASATLSVNGWEHTGSEQVGIYYDGSALKPQACYEARLVATDDAGEKAEATLSFETGLMGSPWDAQWISDPSYVFTEKSVDPKPMVFSKEFALKPGEQVARVRVYATAMGIYELELNGKKVDDRYFAPGFTSYEHTLQYQCVDVTALVGEKNRIVATVAGGWAVGPFSYVRKNRVTADRQALLAQVVVDYADGSREVVGTNPSWDVCEDGPVRMAGFYDGETYDATRELGSVAWHKAAVEKLRVAPELVAEAGDPVRAHEVLAPVSATAVGAATVYDFGQNLAGLVRLHIKHASAGQVVTVRHAEVLNPDGSLNTSFLRTAKATLTYTCKEGEQDFSPSFTYMGFRYASVEGIAPEDVEVEAVALYSDLRSTGDFSCSDERLNHLQQNIRWGAKSNFVDIPTDCPQRDERMGWTGDIAVFGATACYNFDMGRFLRKWLRDLRSEQLPSGGMPTTIPHQGFGFPTTIPDMAIDFWGDASVLDPWALYLAEGDLEVLRQSYDSMRRYVDACRFWAGIGLGDHRYIWHTPSFLHFGDWVAPDAPKMSQWQGRSKWTATMSLMNTSALVARAAELLGKTDDAAKYAQLSLRVGEAYKNVFTDGHGKLKEEFQTAYVLPIHFGAFEGSELDAAVANLAALVERGDYKIGTGFPGTPYILFALADNGRADVAYRMLMNEECPSWLYEVKQGATTIWERWDGLDENGECPIGDDGTDLMISYNHYASGAVGDFLYRRVAGLEPVEAGYKRFRVKPLVGGGLTHAEAELECPYGRIRASWRLDGDTFTAHVDVPVSCTCELVLPDGSVHELESGSHEVSA